MTRGAISTHQCVLVLGRRSRCVRADRTRLCRGLRRRLPLGEADRSGEPTPQDGASEERRVDGFQPIYNSEANITPDQSEAAGAQMGKNREMAGRSVSVRRV